MAQLSFSDLIERRVPLTAAEAASLTLAAAEQGAIPDVAEIFLSSTGTVGFVCPASVSPADESARLAFLLHQLLGLDNPDAGERRARVPGGLLVVLARTMRQIDLPVLTPAAFRDALARFGARAEPSMLAAIFWRAARMRAPDPPKVATPRAVASPRRRGERRSQGPTPAELRRWLRQAEREVFRLRQSRAAAASAAVAAAFVVVVAFVIGFGFGDSPTTARASTESVAAANRFADIALVPERPTNPTKAKRALIRTAELQGDPSRDRASAQDSDRQQSRRAPTVEMVNLPRASWAVVRTR